MKLIRVTVFMLSKHPVLISAVSHNIAPAAWFVTPYHEIKKKFVEI